jgi:ribosomal protein L35AE/L33A
VTLGAEVVALILVESKIELGTVLNYRTVERRQQNVVLIIKLRYGNNEQTVIFARIAVYQRRRTIGARTVCPKKFTME